METMTHAIVHFEIDDAVEAVPVNWIFNDGKKCYFPEAVTKTVRQKIRKGEPFDPEWTCFDCRVIKYYDNYRAARNNVSLALVTSDLSGSEKRTHKSSTVCTFVPPHPLSDEVPQKNLDSTSNADNLMDREARSSSSAPCFVLTGDLMPNDVVQVEPQASSVELVVVGGMEAFQHDVLAKLQQMQDVQNSHTELLNLIVDSFKQKDTVSDDKYEFIAGMFPLRSLESVAELEALTCENYNARKELVRCMMSCGGGTMEDAVKLILKYLMTDEVLSAHCCKGHGSKKNRFLDYDSLVQTMLCSLQKNARVLSHATLDNLEQAISKGLKQAMDRLTQQRKQEARLQSTGSGTN